MKGHPRTIAFHLTGAIAGGSATTELRAGPRMDRPFIVRSVEVVPVTGTAVGQFVDVRVAPGDFTTDAAVAPGASIFEPQQALSELPAEDRDVGLPVADVPYDVPMAFEVLEASRVIFVQTRFVAPAIALPVCHVIVVVEEFDVLGDPVTPRPPIAAPPPAPAPPIGGPPVVPVPVPRPPSAPAMGYCGPRLYSSGPVCPLPQGMAAPAGQQPRARGVGGARTIAAVQAAAARYVG